MYSFLLLGFVAVCVLIKHEVSQCIATRELKQLDKLVEERGIFVEEWDGVGAVSRVRYLNRMVELNEVVNELADRSELWQRLLMNKKELHELLSRLAFVSDSEANTLLYQILERVLMHYGKLNCKCDELCECSNQTVEDIFQLILKSINIDKKNE